MGQAEITSEFLRCLMQLKLLQELQLPVQQQTKHPDMFKLPMNRLHYYWKSKVVQIYSNWKNVTGTVDLEKLDKRNLSADEYFAKQEMPIFKLGDRVKIFANEKRIFSKLHKKFGLWKENLIELIGKEAIVMNIASRCAIGVALIENGEAAQIHGLALKLVENGGPAALWKNETDFNVNDEVVIGVDDGTLAFLQQYVRKTPTIRALQLTTLIARVIAFFQGEVMVTFDETTHEMFNPAALQLYKEYSFGKQIKIGKKKDEKKEKHSEPVCIFVIGQNVTMKPDLREVMRTEDNQGNWNYEMTKFYGKVGTVVHQSAGEYVTVRFDSFESYRMDPNNLVAAKRKRKKNKTENPILTDPLKFAVGDIVRFSIDEKNLFGILCTMSIPMQFYSIANHFAAKFIGYADETRGVISFGDCVKLVFGLHLLTKVDAKIAEYHRTLWQSDKNIGVDKEVVLWTGPQYYAKTCVKPFKSGFEKALGEIAIVQGYDENGKAVIKYPDDDNIYSLPEEFLCSPRTEWREDSDANKAGPWNQKTIEVPTTISAIEAQILHSVTTVLKSYGEAGSTKWKSRITEDPVRTDTRLINIEFLTKLEDRAKFLGKFISKMGADNLLDNEYDNVVIVKVEEKNYIQIQFDFDVLDISSKISNNKNHGDTSSVSNKILDTWMKHIDEPVLTENPESTFEQDASANTKLETTMSANELINEPGCQDNSATPFGPDAPYNIPIPYGVRQVVLNLGERNSVLSSQAPSTEPLADAVQPASIIMNPTSSTVINIFGDGENKVNIDANLVRTLNVNHN